MGKAKVLKNRDDFDSKSEDYMALMERVSAVSLLTHQCFVDIRGVINNGKLSDEEKLREIIGYISNWESSIASGNGRKSKSKSTISSSRRSEKSKPHRENALGIIADEESIYPSNLKEIIPPRFTLLPKDLKPILNLSDKNLSKRFEISTKTMKDFINPLVEVSDLACLWSGDTKKAKLWIVTSHAVHPDLTPFKLILEGRSLEVKKFIKDRLRQL